MPDGLHGGEADRVASFLRANPRFLAERPELYRALHPPTRVHGTELADHMAAMLAAERAHAQAMANQADRVLSAGRATAGMAARVQEAVLALMQCSDPLADCIAGELPALLAVDAASLCAEAGIPGALALPRGYVNSLLGTKLVVFAATATPGVHGAATPLARHEALVRIPGRPALLALAARDAAPLDPTQGTSSLAFLGRAIAATIH